MKFAWDLFRHYLLSRRAGALIRTVAWMCMFGVSLGVAALVVVTSVMNGFNEQIRKRLLAFEPHLVVTVPGVNRPDALRAHPLFDELQTIDGAQVQIFENQESIIRTVDGLFQGAIAKGVEPETLAYIMREARKLSQRKEGELESPEVSEASTRLGPGEVMVGIDLARGLGIFEGDKIVVIAPEALLLPKGEAPPFERLTVVGFLRTDIQDLDANIMFYGRGNSFHTFHNSPSREVGYEVRIKNPDSVAWLKPRIEAKGAKVQTWIDRNSALFYALKMEKVAMSAFLGLAALISSFSIITVLVLLLTQKRKDIGLLMSMGLSAKNTRWLFVKVGLLLSSIGILSGMVIGLVICFVVSKYPLPILPNIYYDATIPAKIDARFILGIFFSSALIAYFSADLPARTATKELAAEALGRLPKNS